jgi:hypothetical protein
MYVALSREDRLAFEHLAKHTACPPHIDGWSIFSEVEEQLGRPIPASHDEAGVVPSCFTISLATFGHGLVVVSRETEISNLKSTAVIDQKVSGLHIAMEDVVLVEVAKALQQLKHVALDLRLGEFDIWVIEQSRKIVVHIRRNHVQYCSFPSLCLGSFDGHLIQLKDIVVREHLEQLDLTE